MNFVDASGFITYSARWSGRTLSLDVPELNILANNYRAGELAENLRRELERALRESPVRQRLSRLLPHINDENRTAGGNEPPIITQAATAAEMADVIAEWLCDKLQRAVGEENLREAEAYLAGQAAQHEYDAVWGPIKPVGGGSIASAVSPFPTTPFEELQERYLRWLGEKAPEEKTDTPMEPGYDLSLIGKSYLENDIAAGVDIDAFYGPQALETVKSLIADKTPEEISREYLSFDDGLGDWDTFVESIHGVAHGLIAGANETLELLYLVSKDHQATAGMHYAYFDDTETELIQIPNLPEPTTERGEFLSKLSSWFTPGAGVVKSAKGIKLVVLTVKEKAKAKVVKTIEQMKKEFGHIFIDIKDTKNHLIYGEKLSPKDFLEKSRNKGVSGRHNPVEFDKAKDELNINGVNLVVVKDPWYVNGLKTIEYYFFALEKGKLTNKFKGKAPYKKTLYNPEAYSDDYIFQLGVLAAEKGVAKGLNKMSGMKQFTETAGGMKFIFYFEPKSGLIRSFHPITP